MTVLSAACRRHRSVLLDFVDRAEVRPGTAAALAHLDRCSRCVEELESILMTITTLRRIGEECAALEPSADVWPRLATRIRGWRQRRPAFASTLSGLAMSTALAVVLVLPLGLDGRLAPEPRSGTVVSAPTATLEELRVEAAYLASSRRSGPTSATAAVVRRGGGGVPQNYPDGIRPQQKEVIPSDPGRQSSEAS